MWTVRCGVCMQFWPTLFISRVGQDPIDAPYMTGYHMWTVRYGVCMQFWPTLFISRVGQNPIDAPYMTGYLVISLPEIPYIHRLCMVQTNPVHILLK